MKRRHIAMLCAAGMLLTGCGGGKSDESAAESTAAMETTTAVVVTTTETTTGTDTTTATTETTTQAAETTTVTTTDALDFDMGYDTARPTESAVLAIGDILDITEITRMAADMIGAVDGTSFKYNGNKFEIYKYDNGAVAIADASDGTMTITIDGFAPMETASAVNGDYVMIYNEADAAVIDAFNSLNI